MIDIPGEIARRLGLNQRNVESVLSLLDEGCTIPFISRYRKECTGSLNEVDIRDIETQYQQLQTFQKRQAYVLETIEKSGALTDELRDKIESCTDAAVLEDLYLPYKPKRRTRATVARELGLEPLAKIIMAQNSRNIEAAAQKYVTDKVENVEAAISGACDIIAEWVSEHPKARSWVRKEVLKRGIIKSKFVKGKEEEAQNYLNYENFSRPMSKCPSHQYLALKRGEREGLLKLSVNINDEDMLRSIDTIFVRKEATHDSADTVRRAVEDSYNRLTFPSIENEASSIWKERADEEAIKMFADNLRQLLMEAPLGHKNVMAIDPGFRTGCKVVCLDAQGNLKYNTVIYPQRERVSSALKVAKLVDDYAIEAIALGNGTASRETEQFLRVIHYPHDVKIFVVSESGASVYSASDLAREEFPDYDVTVRGAVSIGRRLIDPLAELVKIDPKSIGVGQYQHDVDQGALKDSLDYTVMSCVNQVGVNVNTASVQLLSYISGIGPALATNIVAYRAENGDFTSRKQLMKVPRMGAKAFEQSAGFLRIPNAKQPLDNTAVHPESYPIVEKMAADLGVKMQDLLSNKDLIAQIDIKKYVTDTVGLPTLTDIIEELKRPGRDPRETDEEEFSFDPNITDIEDVKPGMVLNGIVDNITAFGAFIDIGVHESGLVHISQMADKRVNNPHDVVKLKQRVKVRVLDVDLRRRRISLSMKGTSNL
ncbi:MAG: RNA-binding transcriptional accessory protein [Bacteroidales bacterium]|nr:RNA-binding transcriptional accessory protein [Bacteroidales bacterium]